jgi:release factor glutamine methyltransferase
LPDSDRSIAGLLASASGRLTGGDALADAQLLLARLLRKNRSYLYAHPDFQPDAAQVAGFTRLIARRAAGEPIAYLTGEREFWSLSLQVNPATLIPRHETELLVEQCLARIPADANWRIADLGTGSGAIALALASERPDCHISASDQSARALATASDNARRLGLKNVAFHRGNWFEPLTEQRFQLIASNPPYIADRDPHLTQGDVAHEPRSALTSGDDGLDDIRHIITASPRQLQPGGWLLLEHGHDQANKILDLLQTTGYDEVSDYRDLAGQPRVAAGRIPD